MGLSVLDDDSQGEWSDKDDDEKIFYCGVTGPFFPNRCTRSFVELSWNRAVEPTGTRHTVFPEYLYGIDGGHSQRGPRPNYVEDLFDR